MPDKGDLRKRERILATAEGTLPYRDKVELEDVSGQTLTDAGCCTSFSLLFIPWSKTTEQCSPHGGRPCHLSQPLLGTPSLVGLPGDCNPVRLTVSALPELTEDFSQAAYFPGVPPQLVRTESSLLLTLPTTLCWSLPCPLPPFS